MTQAPTTRRPHRPRRALVWVRRVVVGLLALALVAAAAIWSGRGYVEQRVAEELTKRAAVYGWSMTVDKVHIDWDGHVTFEGIHASGPSGGTLEIERLATFLPPREAWDGKRMPDHLDLYNVKAYLTPASVDAIRARRAERQKNDGESKAPFPTVRLHNADLAFATKTNLGVARVAQADLTLEREPDHWHIDGGGMLELDAPTPATWSLDLAPTRRWAHVVANVAVPVRYTHPSLGTSSVAGVDLAGTPEAIQGHIAQIEILPIQRFGVKEASVAQLDLSMTHVQGRWKPESLRVVRPSITVDLPALLQGPIGTRYPKLVELGDMVARRFFEVKPTSAHASNETQAAPPTPSEERPSAAPVKGSLPFALPGELSSIIDELPGLVIENGAVELALWNGHSTRLQGIGFDTSALQDTDGTAYHFALKLRGAEANISIVLPDDESWPTGSVAVRGLSAKDLFALAERTPPEQLQGELDFDLSVARSEKGELLVDGSITSREGGFFHPRISERTVHHLNAGLDVALRFDPQSDTLWLDRFAASSGPLTVLGKLTIKKVRSDPALTFKLWGDAIPCSAIPAAIPDGMLSTIDELILTEGTMNPVVTGKWRIADPIGFTIKVKDFPGECAPLSVAPHDVLALNSPEYTHTYTQYTTLPEGVTVGPGSDRYVPLDELPPFIPAAMYLTEDRRFFDHGGLRIGLVNRAIRLNLKAGRYVYGGSTLSQQLVKNLFLTRTKTLSRKFEEVLLAWKMEWDVPKDRILELYINGIEFGPDVYGIVQASHFYFDKTPHELSPIEAGYLASLKVKPSQGGKFYLKGFARRGRWWHKRQKYIQMALAEHGYLAPAEVLTSYPWVPNFVYPDADAAEDFRNQWLRARR